MTTLYTMPGTCSLAPNIVVQWTGAPIGIADLNYGDHKTDTYLAVNPKGKVPALQFDDGAVLTEAAAIMQYIAASAGGDLWPAGERERGRIVEALSYMTSEVHADYGPHFAAPTFAETDAAQAEVKNAAYRKLAGHYERLEQGLNGAGGDWLLGRRTPADAFLYVLTRWVELTPLKIADYPALQRFRGRMQDDSSLRKALEVQNMEAV